jgi:uncharacterized repeat protein (TIGR03803 family)
MSRNRFSAILNTVMSVMLALTLVGGASAQGKYKKLYVFSGGSDGGEPHSNLIFDAAGNLYGTTFWGGVFKLTPNLDGSWGESVLSSLVGSTAGLIVDAAGNLYGTTTGDYVSPGAVFQLKPNPDGTWTYSTIYSFTGGNDGATPMAGLVFDAAGNLYGTTSSGGAGGNGTVFRLTPNPDGSWQVFLVHNFLFNGKYGAHPNAGLVFDAAGDLYGTTTDGGTYGYGTVFQLKFVNTQYGWEWRLHPLHQFTGGNDGANPYAGLIFDAAGNLYGATANGGIYGVGASGYGTVFQLKPNPDGTWTEQVLHQFTRGQDGANPSANLIFDAVGNLYGTTQSGGARFGGTVFQLKPNQGREWTIHTLYSFGQPAHGPQGGLIFDTAGNLYGTTDIGGKWNWGVVFEVMPQ